MTRKHPADDVLTAKEAADLLHVSEKTLRRLPLKKIRIGHRTLRYLREDILAYLRGKAA